MGFQGQLASVNLTDIFQTLNMNRQTGTLSVSGTTAVQHIWFEQGQIALCSSSRIGGRPFLINALLRKGLISDQQADEIAARSARDNQDVRAAALASGTVAEPDLDEMCAWCIEEIVCPVFEWREGDFTFTDGGPVADLDSPDVIAMGATRLQTTSLVLEATRREDEWKRIREVVPDPAALYVVDNAGRANLKNVESDPEMLKVLRFLDGRHNVDAISEAVGVSRFDAFAIVAQLVLANIARLCAPQELIDDAATLRQQGETVKAAELLESLAAQNKLPEIIRPLAEVSAELNQVPRAVELYLELIQAAQDQGQLDQALADLDTVIRLSPADPDLHFDRAQVLTELGRSDDAAAAYVSAAQTYLATRDISQAIDACHRAKNLLPRAPDPHRYLAKAYLLDGQTENAVIEYKSLWHALLSNTRPRKALEILKQTLDTDCKFAAVKDQVINHAQSSEAVKTGNAIRMLIYAVAVLVMIGGAYSGYQVWQHQVSESQARDKVQEIKAEMSKQMMELRHLELIDRLQALRRDNSKRPDIVDDCDRLLAEVAGDRDKRGGALLEAAKADLERGRLDDANKAFKTIVDSFPGTRAAIDADLGLHSVRMRHEEQQWAESIADAEAKWQVDEWDSALAKLNELLARKDLPPRIRESIAEKKTRWAASIDSSQEQFRRGERFERQGRKKDSIDAYNLALKGQGEAFRAKAHERLNQIERQFIDELTKRMIDTFAANDDGAAFKLLVDLKKQVKDATTVDAGEFFAQLRLPFTVLVDNPRTFLVIKRPSARDETVRAPDGTKAGWKHVLKYGVDETVSLEARRPGFGMQTVIINADGKRSSAAVSPKRGPLWSTQLVPPTAAVTTAPAASGKYILVGTSKPSLEVVDAGLGSTKPIVFPNAAFAELGAPPFLFENRAFVVVEDQIVAIDLTNRQALWHFPDDGGLAQIAPFSLWVQEHELKPDSLQIFAATTGAQNARLIILSVENDEVKDPQSVPLDSGITGAPFVDRFGTHTTLYVPAGQSLYCFDATEPKAPPVIFRTKGGDLIGRPARALVGDGKPGGKKRPAILVTDSAGIVSAYDANPDVPNARRGLGSWSLSGTPTGVVCDPNGSVAYVSVSEGSLLFLDLANPGQLIKRFPAQGKLGTLAGTPAVGRLGVYVADDNGMLYCVDRQTGIERWRSDLGSKVKTGPLAYEGRIYVPTTDSLHCFEEGEE